MAATDIPAPYVVGARTAIKAAVRALGTACTSTSFGTASKLSKLVTVRNHDRPVVRARNCLRNHDRRNGLCFLND